MTRQPRELVRRLRTLRGVAPNQRWNAVRHVATERTLELSKRGRRRLVTGQVKLVQMSFGPSRANWYFWRALSKHPTWFDVQRRIEYLAAQFPEHRAHFVLESIRRTDDPVTIASIARHPFGSDELRSYLSSATAEAPADFRDRLRDNQMLGGAFVGAARVVLPSDQAEQFAAWVTDIYDAPEEQFFRQADSVSWWPARRRTGSAAQVVSHRLIIAESADDPDVLALLLPGAIKTTVLLTNDTFGDADLDDYLEWPGVGEVNVEHLRSRITRFSQEYIDLHEATARLARSVAADVAEIPGLIASTDVRHLEVEIADFLFFQALKVRAIEALLDENDFDHIVLGTTVHRPTDEFVRIVAGVHDLTTDDRLEVVSLSRSAIVRNQFWWVIESLNDPVTLPPPPFRRPSSTMVVKKVDRLARRAAASLRRFPASDRPWVPVATANNPAYNSSTAAYVHELQAEFDVRLVHLGRNATDVADHLVGQHAGSIAIDFITPTSGAFGSFVQLLEIRMTQTHCAAIAPQSDAQRAAVWALHCCVRRLASDAVAPAIERLLTLDHWFAAMKQHDELPSAFVLSPHRNAGVGAVASVARRFDVPTIAVEPHAQDANYCRYAKVAADYYGVMSNYFREQTADTFGIGSERTFVIGSPRQVAPAGYDPARSRAAARTSAEAAGLAFGDDHLNLVFFGQPSDWSHVSRVWANVLDAAKDQNCRVLLKAHPEEQSSRATAYMEIAVERGCDDIVVCLDGNAANAVALSDIVVTAYSSAGVDAAIRQTPVICVTDGDLPYPLDLPAMVGAHHARSASELSDLLAHFQADRAAFERQATSLIEREDQFVTGPGPRLRALVDQVRNDGPSGIRLEHDVPTSLFLDGPHPVFPV